MDALESTGMGGFEVFRSKGARGGTGDTLTIGKRGQLSIGQDAYQQLGKPEAVELLYDRKAKLLGLRPVAATSETAYIVRGGDISHTVSGMALLRHYGIPFGTAAIRRRGKMAAGIFWVDLNDPGVEVTSNRAKTDDR